MQIAKTLFFRHPVQWILLPLFSLGVMSAMADDFSALRAAMVEEITADVRETSSYIDRDTLTDQVMQVMGRVPRHEFVPLDMQPLAYENRPLPIGYGQTISQPYIVALMTELLEPTRDFKVLEVGTGSGYQAAVLAELTRQVFSIEIIEELGEQAEQRFKQLGINNVETRIGDGYYGWPEQAPFDAILVTAAADHIPPPLIKQLKPGGRMIIPVGGRFQVQQLVLVEKTPEGKTTTHQILPVRFVPLTRTD
jgi:protein-L-isoaspartate(D-aspartate) O-methyltransferase